MEIKFPHNQLQLDHLDDKAASLTPRKKKPQDESHSLKEESFILSSALVCAVHDE
jgi:hypothetical protein